MGFRETGYFFLILIMFFNIGLTFFAPGATTSSYILQHGGTELDSTSQIDYGQIPTTGSGGSTFVASSPTTTNPPTTTQANKPTNDSFAYVYSLINDLLFAGANAVEQSGIPYPLDWIFAFVIKAFVTCYAFIFGLEILTAVRGGGGVNV